MVLTDATQGRDRNKTEMLPCTNDAAPISGIYDIDPKQRFDSGRARAYLAIVRRTMGASATVSQSLAGERE
jgi:hypothetical protein